MTHQFLYFFTATILKWIPILNETKSKEVITNSLHFLVNDKRCKVYGFVIMPNHIHLIWRPLGKHELSDIQRDFLKFTGQQILFALKDNNSSVLNQLEVNLKDRRYQVWQRNPLNIKLTSREMIEQKLDYIHANPVSKKWNLASDYANYKYSSASYYLDDNSNFSFLTHYMEYFGF